MLCGFTASFRVFVLFFVEVGVFIRRPQICWQPLGIPKDSIKPHIFRPTSKTVPFDDVPLVRFESENLTGGRYGMSGPCHYFKIDHFRRHGKAQT